MGFEFVSDNEQGRIIDLTVGDPLLCAYPDDTRPGCVILTLGDRKFRLADEQTQQVSLDAAWALGESLGRSSAGVPVAKYESVNEPE